MWWREWHSHLQMFRCQRCADPWHRRNHLVAKVWHCSFFILSVWLSTFLFNFFLHPVCISLYFLIPPFFLPSVCLLLFCLVPYLLHLIFDLYAYNWPILTNLAVCTAAQVSVSVTWLHQCYGGGGGVINKIFSTVINRMIVTLWSCCTMTLRDFSNQAYLHTKSDLLNLKVWFTLLSHAFYPFFFFFLHICLPSLFFLSSFSVVSVICCTYFFISPDFQLSFDLLIALLLFILFLLFVCLPVWMCVVMWNWEWVLIV